MADLTWKNAIVAVLKKAGEPMHYTDIAEAIAEQGLKTKLGSTPANSIAATISVNLTKNGDRSPFVHVARGMYFLRHPPTPSLTGGSLGSGKDEADTHETGLINAFGMYWARGKVSWNTVPKLLGAQQPGSKPVDFSGQKGVYLLYDARDVVYVGRTTEQPLGTRMRQHTVDRLNGRWDRFSWFGVHAVSAEGILSTVKANSFSLENLIATMEALFIEGLEPPQNRKRGDDFRAVEFLQVEDEEIKKAQAKKVIAELLRNAGHG